MTKLLKKDISKTKKIILILGIIFACIIAFIIYICFSTKKYNNLIFPGVKIGDIDLGGKTQGQAVKLLEKNHKNVLKNKITIKTNDKQYYILYSDLKPKYDINSTVNKAYEYGKNETLFKKFALINSHKTIKLQFKINYRVEPINKVLNEIKKEVNKNFKNATIEIENSGNLKIVSEQNGEKLEEDKLINDIKSNIESTNCESFKIKVPIKITKPKITAKELEPIDALIASASTTYGSSTYQRATNIYLAAKSINGLVIMPGQTFSFNNTVGKRTKDKGYKNAGVIIGNKVDSGIGGGICQVSSTLYNAILKTGLNSVERYHHSFPSSYVPYGMDATVNYDSIDYKFKNTFKYPIFIQASTGGRVITFNIYSNKSLTNKKYVLKHNTYKTINPTIEYINDSTLNEGEIQQVQPAHTGYKVRVYRYEYEGGKLINKQLISDDFYRPVSAIIRKGTKKPDTTPVANTKKTDDKTVTNDKKNNNNVKQNDNKNINDNKKPKDNKKTVPVNNQDAKKPAN